MRPVEAELHPDVAPLAGLLGTWRGQGTGRYPTVEGFAYREELAFWHVGKPFLAYRQQTWSSEDGRPLHGEMGYWRAVGEGRLELVLAHPTGVTEVADGSVDDGVVEFASTAIGLTPTAKEVTRPSPSRALEGLSVFRFIPRAPGGRWPRCTPAAARP